MMMTNEELAGELQELALSLENSISLCTTRVEHIRVAAHAAQARRLANATAAHRRSEPLTGTGAVENH